MGYSISWIGIQRKGKQAILDELGLIDTGEADEANESPVSGAELPNGWFILFLNRDADRRIVRDAPPRLSSAGPVLVCHVEEHSMVSEAICYEQGVVRWSVIHDSSDGIYDLKLKGEAPPDFETVKHELTQQQNAAGGKKADADYIFDVPLLLAERRCGYKHDKWRFDWGEPAFTCLASKSELPSSVRPVPEKKPPRPLRRALLVWGTVFLCGLGFLAVGQQKAARDMPPESALQRITGTATNPHIDRVIRPKEATIETLGFTMEGHAITYDNAHPSYARVVDRVEHGALLTVGIYGQPARLYTMAESGEVILTHAQAVGPARVQFVSMAISAGVFLVIAVFGFLRDYWRIRRRTRR